MENKNMKYGFSIGETNHFTGAMLKRSIQAIKKDPKKQLNSYDWFEFQGGGEDSINITASSSSEATRKLEKALMDYRNKEVKRDRNAYYQFTEIELSLVDNKLPKSQDKSIFRNIINKYTKPMFNTPTGRGPSDLEQLVRKEKLDEPLMYGAM
tara:strand:+ start:93 stop:551 length:459 start_codon:yes stop_codon:yes gene_type:complete